MTPEYPPSSSWQMRLIQVFVVIVFVVLSFFLLTKVAASLASGISNDSVAVVTIEEGREVEFTVASGSTAVGIAADLAEAGVIADAGEFESAVRAAGAGNQLKAGDYLLTSGTDYPLLVSILVAGPEQVEVRQITVIEGLDITEMLASIAEQTGYTETQLAAPLLNGTIDSPYLPDELPEGLDELTKWEGLLAPDTYEFRIDASPADILGVMADTLARRVSEMDWGELEPLGLDPYEGLIIASLIEKEAKLDDERATIASVITNRIREGIALQIDATIIYALGENRGEVLNRDLEVDSPYNTYLYPGLPPTPIGGVRTASIEAAANPEETNYFYYVLISSDGEHGFSETLEEHNRKKQEAKDAGGPHAVRLALLGSPVAHSLSPVMHEAALRHVGIEGTYAAYDVDDIGFRGAIDDLAAGRLTGANVTMPHKDLAYSLCDVRSPEAERARAVNTLSQVGGSVIGSNTDIGGVTVAWRKAGLAGRCPGDGARCGWCGRGRGSCPFGAQHHGRGATQRARCRGGCGNRGRRCSGFLAGVAHRDRRGECHPGRDEGGVSSRRYPRRSHRSSRHGVRRRHQSFGLVGEASRPSGG